MQVHRREFLKTLSMGVTSFMVLNCAKTSNSAKPDILFIMADDMGYGDPGCYNPHSKIPTPNIDGLASEGIRFTHMHSPGAWCVPARYGLLTGRYPFRNERDHHRTSKIEPGRMTLGSLLQRNGYHTACIGKWHLGFDDFDQVDYSQPFRGGPVDRGFDTFFGMHASLDIPPYYFIEDDHCVEPPTETIAASHSEDWYRVQGAFWREGKIASGFKHDQVLPTFTNKAVQFINEHQKKRANQPFFLYLALASPHTPWLPDEKFRGKSKAGMYGDFVSQTDAAVGQVLQTLEELGLRDNTLVFFTSDNGPVWFGPDVEKYGHRSTYFLKGLKADTWEGGHCMPFIARWPGKIKPNSVTEETACFTDMLATFAAVVGDRLPKNAGEDSYDILPMLLDEPHNKPLREATVIQNAIIQGDWKLIIGSGLGGLDRRYLQDHNIKIEEVDSAGELYNLKNDPSESKNLYTERQDVVERLTAIFEKYKKEGRSVPLFQ